MSLKRKGIGKPLAAMSKKSRGGWDIYSVDSDNDSGDEPQALALPPPTHTTLRINFEMRQLDEAMSCQEKRTAIKGCRYRDRKGMCNEDTKSTCWNLAMRVCDQRKKIGLLMAKNQEWQAYGSQTLASTPLFRAGQSVHQWWAGWMQKAQSPPALIAGNRRPSWYSGEILAMGEHQTIRYAGLLHQKTHTYWLY